MTEGTSALFVLSSGAEDREMVAEEMKATYDFEILWTNLPDEQLEKLREVFASWQRPPSPACPYSPEYVE